MMTVEIYNRLKINKTTINDNAMLFETLREIKRHKIDGTMVYHIIAKKINNILKTIHLQTGYWGRNNHPDSNDNDVGVMYLNDWHRLNTLDTNDSGLFKVFNDCNIFLRNLRENGVNSININGKIISTNKIFIDTNWTDDINSSIEKIMTLIDIIDYNAMDWLHPESKTCEETMRICRESMLLGDAGEFIFKMYTNQFFSDITKLKYTTGLGDPNDRKEGIDCWITHNTNINETIQVKTSFYSVQNNGDVLSGANFSVTSKCTLFVIVKNKSIILIKNNNYKNKRFGNDWLFHKDCVENEIEIINMLEELKELMRIAGNNRISLTLSKEGEENSINYNEEERIIVINFPDEFNENIKSMIVEKTEELKKMFQ